MFDSIGRDVLPVLAQAARDAGRTTLDCWSAGCACGEEPYTLAILWQARLQPAIPHLALRIVATDCDCQLLQRARIGCYEASSLKELSADLRAAAFEQRNHLSCVRPEFQTVEFLHQDLRRAMPAGPFDLVLLRNVLATYYAPDVQRATILGIADRMRAGGGLVLGIHETLADGLEAFVPWPGTRAVYRRTAIREQPAMAA